MFEIKEKVKPEKRFTHDIYFNGKLFATEVYEEKDGGYFYEDREATLEDAELMPIPAASLPDRVCIDHFKEDVYKTFTFGSMERKGNRMELSFWICFSDYTFNEPGFDIFGFFYYLKLHAKKSTSFESSVEDINFDLKYFCEAEGTVGDVYKKALSDLEKICNDSIKAMNKTEIDFLRSN